MAISKKKASTRLLANSKGMLEYLMNPLSKIFICLIFTQTSWGVWPIANFVMLRYVPEELQILFGNVIAFAWNIYKSLIVMRK